MPTDDWTLTAAQMAFMINVEAAAELAYQNDDNAFFDSIVETEEWKEIFGDMSWDAAYDRYEEMQKGE